MACVSEVQYGIHTKSFPQATIKVFSSCVLSCPANLPDIFKLPKYDEYRRMDLAVRKTSQSLVPCVEGGKSTWIYFSREKNTTCWCDTGGGSRYILPTLHVICFFVAISNNKTVKKWKSDHMSCAKNMANAWNCTCMKRAGCWTLPVSSEKKSITDLSVNL